MELRWISVLFMIRNSYRVIDITNYQIGITNMKIPFTASARTAMLIGSENFSNPEGAIIELVKNTYDADSAYCYILFDCTDEQIT